MFVEVAVNIPSDKTFTYRVPDPLKEEVLLGKRILVPFGKRIVSGYILGEVVEPERTEVKDVIKVLDPEPLFHKDDLAFYRWLSKYYYYPLGKALHEILPGGIHPKGETWITLCEVREAGDHMGTSAHTRIIETITQSGGSLPLAKLQRHLGKMRIKKELQELQSMGILRIEERFTKPTVRLKKDKVITLLCSPSEGIAGSQKEFDFLEYLHFHGPTPLTELRRRFPRVGRMISKMVRKGIVACREEELFRHHGQRNIFDGPIERINLNEDQELALKEIIKGLEEKRFFPCLLHGVTGSGKTEVYLHAIKECLARNGGVIFLVPEIALTPQLITRFRFRFPDVPVALIHSGVSKASRYDQWRRILRGEINVVIGARSAIFAPVKHLKLIIVDEEHDTSYKQEERMRYNARDAAIMRAQLLGATVILGSATPAIHTYFKMIRGSFSYLTLPRRVEERPLPMVEIVDMKQEKRQEEQGVSSIFSRPLIDALGETLEKREQALLFLNRRGFHTFILCQRCGYVCTCTRCAVSLTYHAEIGLLKCHYCDYTLPLPSVCPDCCGNHLHRYGVGTEKLEDEVKKILPHARVARMDSDITTRKGVYDRILNALFTREIDILVGTQMITKGHDFPGITLVGVISADTSLNLPDFRAAERTFQLLVQVAGRGGRGDSPGRVIIQTFNPDHYALVAARTYDYMGFYRSEIALRRSLFYPPFSRMVNFLISSPHKTKAIEDIENIKTLLQEFTTGERNIEIVGPTEAPIHKLRGKYRWHILVKGRDTKTLHAVIREIHAKIRGKNLDVKVDVDPMSFM